ncbi:MAG: isoprenylcysteine carboxylmethyltransferase family protein [Pseudomonadota bacterium]
MSLKIPPPVIGLSCALVMWLLAKALPITVIELPARTLLAILLAVIAIVIDVSALWAFRKAKTTINPLSPQNSSSVVTTGIYRYSRNPMYLGMLLLLIALGIYLGKLSPWVMPPLFIWLINQWQIKPEEKILTGMFGESYQDYMNNVRRWL